MQEFTPTQYLQIDIATNYGLDKEDWTARLAWFQDYENVITEVPLKTLKTNGFLRSAKEPALVLAGILAYRKMLDNQPVGYLIGLDATASGLQLLSVLARCELSSMLCNVINVGSCVDGYTEVYKACRQNGLRNSGITRKQAKQALMT